MTEVCIPQLNFNSERKKVEISILKSQMFYIIQLSSFQQANSYLYEQLIKCPLNLI